MPPPDPLPFEAPRIFKPAQAAEFVPTQAGYDRWAEIYDDEDNPLIALEEPRIVQLLGDVTGLEVLELGSGTGRWTMRLLGWGARVTAVEFSEAMIARAQHKPGFGAVRLLRHDLTRTPLPLAAGAFDRVVCFLVLDHIADLGAFFGECRRVSRPHAEVLVSTMHPAMMLRGIQAHFRDPHSGQDVCPASAAHQVSDYVMGALRAGLSINHLSEHAVDGDLAARSPRASKYLGWPMLLLMRLRVT